MIDIQALINNLGLIGIGVGGIGYASSQLAKGKAASNSDLLKSLQDQINGQKTVIEGLTKELKNTREQMIGLVASNTEKDKTIASYLAILQNRNPELEEFMKSQREISKQAIEYMNNTTLILNKIVEKIMV